MTPASTGQSLMLRVLKSSSWIVLNFGAAQVLRLASNLILTRILFPEAFGLMALVTMVLIGLALFSDVGISNAIAQNPRGDDPEFLDTAWSLQLCRGAGLWAMTGLLALPAAAFYDAPEMAYCLPIAGFGLLLHGFSPTRVETAYRHLLIGRVTVINLGAQIVGLVCLSGLAYWSQSVLALAFGNVIQEAARLALIAAFLPGRRNQFRWHAETRREIIGMGKWIFLSTAFYFMTSQGDRAILGKHLTLSAMGIYNIGFFLASFPVQIGQELSARLMLAVYRDKPAHAAPDNRKKQRQLRYALSGGVLLIMWTMAWIGPWLVGFLYDDRYSAAGAIIVLLVAARIPSVIISTYDRAALAAGHTRGFFVYTATQSLLQTGLFLLGVSYFGLFGGICALGLSVLLSYPVLLRLARRYQAQDPLHDLLFLGLSALICGGAISYHWDRIVALQVFG